MGESGGKSREEGCSVNKSETLGREQANPYARDVA